MPITHVALFRAVNVGGHGLLSMSDLRLLLVEKGLREVRTLLQSGNALFDAGNRRTEAIERALERALHDRLSLSSDVFVRSAAEWNALIAANPFGDEAAENPARLIAMVLRDRPSAAAVEALQQATAGNERVCTVERQLYAVYPQGMGGSKLTGHVIEKLLKTRGTARNWNTVIKIAAQFPKVTSTDGQS